MVCRRYEIPISLSVLLVADVILDLPSLLEHVLAAGLVADELLCFLPPRLGTVEVHSPRPHGHAGIFRRRLPRLVNEAVEDHPVDTKLVGMVALALEGIWRYLPASAVARRRERLRTYDPVSPRISRLHDHLHVSKNRSCGEVVHVRART